MGREPGVQVKRGMQSQLVALMRNPNEMVAQSAMEAIFFLSNNPENRKALAQTSGLPEAIQAAVKSEVHAMRSVAEATLANLSEYVEQQRVVTTPANSSSRRRRSMARAESQQPAASQVGWARGRAEPVGRSCRSCKPRATWSRRGATSCWRCPSWTSGLCAARG